MYELRRFSAHQHIRALVCFLVGALASLQVNAQSVAVPDAAFQRFMWTTTGANSQSVTVGTGGVPVVSPTGSGTLAADGTKSLAYSRNATWRNGSNNPVSGSIAAKIPINAKTAKILTAGMKLIPLLSTGYALFDFAREIGFDVSRGPAGDLVVQQPAQYYCASTGGCTFYALNDTVFYSGPYSKTFADACTSGGTYYARKRNYASAVGRVTGPTSCAIDWVAGFNGPFGTSGTDTGIGFQTTVKPYNIAQDPSTVQALEDAIAAKAGWPSSSNIAKAVRDAAQATGQSVDVEAPKVTGPATSPGTTTTTQNPNGTTTTNNTTHNHIYNDNRVTNTTTRSSTVTNNTTGATETTTTTEQPVEQPSECEKNPGSLNCADLDTPTGEIPKAQKTITYAPQDMGFGGGSCPADKYITPHAMTAPIKLIDWADNCSKITTYVKPVMLAAAGFMALMILFVGGKVE